MVVVALVLVACGGGGDDETCATKGEARLCIVEREARYEVEAGGLAPDTEVKVLVDGGGSATGFVGPKGAIDGTLAFIYGDQEPDRLTAVATTAAGKPIRVTHQN